MNTTLQSMESEIIRLFLPVFFDTPDFYSILPIVTDRRNKRSECNLSRYKGQESDDYYYRSNRTRVASSGTR